MLCGALLHDVVEDTHFTIDDIYQKFGSVVADLVSDLTDISRPEDGNRKTRKEIDRQHTARASKNAKTIKLADLIENSESIIRYDIHFARTYLYEKMLLLDVLKEGDKNLWKTAYDIVEKYKDLWI
jgi:(p)ppGpp synthase/HD superfamily hydrolase